MENTIGIFVAVCERDFHWFKQFSHQAKILGYPVAIFADHLSPESLILLREDKNVIFVHDNQTEQFSERSKELAFNYLRNNHFAWAIQMDIDETWQDGAKTLIEQSLSENENGDIGNCPMVTVDNREGEFFRRTDKYFVSGVESARERIYNLKREWHWIDPITCGAYAFVNGAPSNEGITRFECPAISVHWGYSTQDLRLDHTEKWHDVWNKTVGRIPYQSYGLHSDLTYEIPVVPLEEVYFKHL